MLKGAIIGFGEVARHGHLPTYKESSDVKIVAVVDRTDERRRLARELLPTIATFSNIEELANNVEIDFVDICTPPAFHGEPMFESLTRGWHVLCEKPLVLDLVDLEKARNLIKQSGRAIVPVHN